MLNLINITQARNNLSKLIDKVVSEKQPIFLIRQSIPQAVILPYEQYQKQVEQWQKKFEKALSSARKQFKKYLKDKNLPYPKTEEQMYQYVEKTTSRY